MALDSDEWIKKLASGWTVRYSYHCLISGFSASAEIIEPSDAAMIYTHIRTDLPMPANREQIEAEFLVELTKATIAPQRKHWRAYHG